jgi:phthalate 4,5-dioxygenase
MLRADENDRTAEHLGAADRAVSKMRHVLLTAARDLADGKEPPAVAGDLDYASIRGAEKILEPGEDWRPLGTNADPLVQEALGPR